MRLEIVAFLICFRTSVCVFKILYKKIYFTDADKATKIQQYYTVSKRYIYKS